MQKLVGKAVTLGGGIFLIFVETDDVALPDACSETAGGDTSDALADIAEEGAGGGGTAISASAVCRDKGR